MVPVSGDPSLINHSRYPAVYLDMWLNQTEGVMEGVLVNTSWDVNWLLEVLPKNTGNANEDYQRFDTLYFVKAGLTLLCPDFDMDKFDWTNQMMYNYASVVYRQYHYTCSVINSSKTVPENCLWKALAQVLIALAPHVDARLAKLKKTKKVLVKTKPTPSTYGSAATLNSLRSAWSPNAGDLRINSDFTLVEQELLRAFGEDDGPYA